MGVMIPILAIFFAGMISLSKTGIGKALAQRIAGGAAPGSDVEARIQDLERDVDTMRQQLSEAEERIDFSERALTQLRDAKQLPRSPS